MTASNAPGPLTKRGFVLIWFAIVFVALVGAGGGGGLITTGLAGRAAVSGGTPGTFTPTSRTCVKDGCTWIGDYVSENGAIARTGVPLHDAVRVERNDPMPTRVHDVLLGGDADRPAAYTADFDSTWSIIGGTGLLVLCLVVAAALIRAVLRHQSRARARVRTGR